MRTSPKYAYYNEIDKYVAQWLRNLIAAGLIAPGEVDERSIKDVQPVDVKDFAQCHFFAGIGGWSHALRLAGWPDDRPVWTGSCPCQPFSVAGKGGGFDDERHLWPDFHRLIRERRPVSVFGEQVASKDADTWLDLVQDDLEALDYAFGAVPYPAASIGAPHIRDRLYWMAHHHHQGLEGWDGMPKRGAELTAGPRGVVDGLADTGDRERRGRADNGTLLIDWTASGRHEITGDAQRNCDAIRLADSPNLGRREERQDAGRLAVGDRTEGLAAGLGTSSGDLRAGPTNGFWRDADWLLCRDGKWRPVKPSTFPLANGIPNRVGQLRAYGNAIVPQAAAEFIAAFMEYRP